MFERFAERISKRNRPTSDPVLLDRHRTFILPTRAGFIFAFMLLVMLVGSINYNKSLGFMLTFLLAGMAIISILHTYRNIAQLRIRPGVLQSVFVNEFADYALLLENTIANTRFNIGIQIDSSLLYTDIKAGGRSTVTLFVCAKQRGIFNPGRITIFTQYPLGLFRAWSWIEFRANALAYPAPEKNAPPLTTLHGYETSEVNTGIGNEDYYGLRSYQSGDSPRHIAWKAVVRQQSLLTKQFAASASNILWLDWEATAGLETEDRLSRLSRWVLDAHAANCCYGLRLPEQIIEPNTGERHRQSCLAALALYNS